MFLLARANTGCWALVNYRNSIQTLVFFFHLFRENLSGNISLILHIRGNEFAVYDGSFQGLKTIVFVSDRGKERWFVSDKGRERDGPGKM